MCVGSRRVIGEEGGLRDLVVGGMFLASFALRCGFSDCWIDGSAVLGLLGASERVVGLSCIYAFMFFRLV